MKFQPRIAAGTALGLLVASAPLGAFSFAGAAQAAQGEAARAVILAQAECQGEDCAVPNEREQRRKQREQRQQEQQQGEQQAPQRQPEAEQAAPAPEQPASDSGQKREQRRKQREQQQQGEQQAPQRQPEAEQAAPAPEQPASDAEQKREQRRKQREQQQQEQQQGEQQAPQRQPEAEQTAPEQPASDAEHKREQRRKQREQQQQEQQQGEQQAPEVAPTPPQRQQPAEAQQGGEAPILDSQKDLQRPARGEGDERQRRKPAEAGAQGQQPAQPPAAAAEQGPPPADDRAAQQAIQPEKIQPVTQEKGKRLDRAPNEDIARRPRPEGADVLKEIGNRVILQFNNQTMVESDDRQRLRYRSKDVYYEDLPRGQVRETIERDNGVRVVTIRNRNGDVIRRSRITPDGREYVLNYVDERYYGDVRDWRDPGDDLPPLRLTIPRDRYIFDAEEAHGPDDYYDFLEQPPVERVQRLYSIDEVKRSARVRDIARRVDLDTLNFDFGSATISQGEAEKLEGVADAMERLLEKNPAEMFLIEGHTDAVGSDTANLALSDRRAEAVAEALTDMFDIPPENLTTQGYGERYLKVSTQAPERQNRRVAIRRITPLVAPAVSAR